MSGNMAQLYCMLYLNQYESAWSKNPIHAKKSGESDSLCVSGNTYDLCVRSGDGGAEEWVLSAARSPLQSS